MTSPVNLLRRSLKIKVSDEKSRSTDTWVPVICTNFLYLFNQFFSTLSLMIFFRNFRITVDRAGKHRGRGRHSAGCAYTRRYLLFIINRIRFPHSLGELRVLVKLSFFFAPSEYVFIFNFLWDIHIFHLYFQFSISQIRMQSVHTSYSEN